MTLIVTTAVTISSFGQPVPREQLDALTQHTAKAAQAAALEAVMREVGSVPTSTAKDSTKKKVHYAGDGCPGDQHAEEK